MAIGPMTHYPFPITGYWLQFEWNGLLIIIYYYYVIKLQKSDSMQKPATGKSFHCECSKYYSIIYYFSVSISQIAFTERQLKVGHLEKS